MKPKLSYLKATLLFLTIGTLPMYMRINNLFLGLFLSVGILDIILNFNKGIFRVIFYRGWPILSFFLLAILASFHNPEWESFKFLDRYLAFLLVPAVIITDPALMQNHRKGIFISLLIGCTITLIICYANVLIEMYQGHEPMDYFFRWRHLGHQFTEIADTHPTYLGLFIVVAQLYLLREPKFPAGPRILVFLFLSAGLFQLASRMALLLFLCMTGVLLIHRLGKRKWHMLVLAAALAFCAVTYVKYGSQYFAKRLFTQESFLNDKRFARWEVSYEIFREHPFFGVGFEQIEPLRHEKYLKYGFDQAASEDLNAHNQFLEYLARNGAIGGFIYVISMGYLLILAIFRRDLFFSALFALFILAGLTESTMVRIKGIEFIAVFGSLFLSIRPREVSQNMGLDNDFESESTFEPKP